MSSLSPNISSTSNSGSAVGNNWMGILNSGLNGSGTYSNAPAQNQTQAVNLGGMNYNLPTSGASSNPSGGMGTPGASPSSATAQTSGLAGYINNNLNSNPSQLTYSNPNNPQPAGYTPTAIPTQAAQQYSLPTLTNPGPSSTFNATQTGQQAIASGLANAATGQNTGTNPNSISAPTAPGVQAFSSNGILGPESNVASAITAAANLQSQQALAAQNARFTQMGGMSGGSPAAYATAQTNAQQAVGLANSLAQSDINYRNLDLGAYQAQNQAQQQQYGTQANIYGTQNSALSNYNQLGLGYANTGLNAANSAANILGNVAGQQFNQQQMGFNYGQLGQQGQLANNQLNLNSALGFGQLNNTALQNNNQNAYNSANLAQNAYNSQGQLDLGTQQMGYSSQNNLINNLFNSYNNAYNHGTPQAQTTVAPSDLSQVASGIGGLAQAAAGTGLLGSIGSGSNGGVGTGTVMSGDNSGNGIYGQFTMPQNINMPGLISSPYMTNNISPAYG